VRLKHIFRDWTGLRRFTAQLVPWFLKFVRLTWLAAGYKEEWHPEAKALYDAQQPALYCVWHGRLFALMMAFSQHKPAVLISQSRDGDFITTIGHGLGYKQVIRGAFGRGGVSASRDLLEALSSQPVMVTVDGPRGPRYQFKPALLKLAAKTGVPLVMVHATCGFKLWQVMRSWDHFVAPMFFSRIQLCFDAPVIVPPELLENEAALTLWQEQLHNKVQATSAQLDDRLGSLQFLP
jgi:lysophospholipid acyltransferase (LPLAT)-like uncharacterized protein